MKNFEMIQTVIAANRAIQMEARKWNTRAGETVFSVMTNEEWKVWLGNRLNGAISCATVYNLESLRLPALDSELVNLTREMNPDSITLFGRQLSVEYREPYCGTPRPPQITLGDEFISNNRWNELPDEGVKLPGGRALNIILKPPSSWSVLAEGSNIPALKQAMKNRLNEEQWVRFDRPVITVPTTIDDATVLPEIATAFYGKCAVTGEDLHAFGTVTAYRYWSSDPITWKPEWFRSRFEAEDAFSKAQAELEKAKAEARNRLELETVQKAARVLREKAIGLYGTIPYDPSGVRAKLYSYAYLQGIPLSSVEEVRAWINEAESVILIAEADASAIKQKQEEAEAQRLSELAKENENLLKWARPILMPEEVEGQGTLYGMPCRYETGPCDPEVAEYWGLYSYARDKEKLSTHKGFRSSTTGTTLMDLVVTYMKGDGRLPQVLARMRGRSVKPAEPIYPSINPQPVKVEDAADVLASMWGARRKK